MANNFTRIKLLIPAIVLFLGAAGFLYSYVRIDARTPMLDAKFAKLQGAIQEMDCQLVDKDAVLSIVRESDEMEHRYAQLFLLIAALFSALGILNLAIVLSHLRKTNGVLD